MAVSGRRIAWIVPILTIGAALSSLSVCRADVVTLRNGGIVRGRLAETSFPRGKRFLAPSEQDSKSVAIVTLSGARLVLDSSDVKSTTRRPLVLEEYDFRNRATPHEVEPLWELAEWCRNKGLKAQRESVLRRILEIDPDHVKAHQGLGQGRYNGQWKTYDEEMRSRGFVKFQGRYVTEQEVELLKQISSKKRVDHDWGDRVRGWTNSLLGGDPDRKRRAFTELSKINSPEAIPALNRSLRSSELDDVRQLYVNILNHMPGPAPIPFLVEQSLYDASQSVRSTAIDAITNDRRTLAMPLYIRHLHDPENIVVRRAGRMLEKIGDEGAIPDLIEALVTTHAVNVQVADTSNTYSFGTTTPYSVNGQPLPADVYSKLVTGQYPNGVIVNNPASTAARVRTVTVDKPFENLEVRAALEKLTKQSFGYDKDQWRRWWSARVAGVANSSKQP